MTRIAKDRKRSSLDRLKRLQLARQDKPDSRMGDLHLRQYGIQGRSGQRLRRKLKRTSSRARRRHGREIARRYM